MYTYMLNCFAFLPICQLKTIIKLQKHFSTMSTEYHISDLVVPKLITLTVVNGIAVSESKPSRVDLSLFSRGYFQKRS